nr:Uncharacterised protein [Raoultella sp. NCTC 9187]
MAVAEHLDAVVAVEAAAFGVGDTFIGLQRHLFSAGGQLDGPIRRHFRRVEQVKIRGVKGQQLFIGNAGKRVRRGIAGNIQRRLHRTGNRLRAKIG